MALKSSWMVMAVMFLIQSTVLAAPTNQNLPIDPTDLLPLGTFDKSKSFGGLDPNDKSNFTDTSALSDMPQSFIGDLYGHVVKKSNRRTASDADSKDPASCEPYSDGERYPDTKPYSGNKNGGAQDPTWIDDDSHNSTDQLAGNWYDKKNDKPLEGAISDPSSTEDNSYGKKKTDNSYGKKKTNPVDGTISDPTFTDDLYNSTTYPVKSQSDGSDSYATGKRATKPANGTVSDPTFTNGSSRHTATYPDVSCYCEKKPHKLADGTISDPTNTEDNCYKKKNSKKTGTISDAEGRQGHTATGKPCIVYSSSEHDKLPYADKDTSYLGGKERCILDVNQESEKNFDNSKHSYPYTFGSNEDDNDKQS